MARTVALLILAVSSMLLAGCGKSANTPGSATAPRLNTLPPSSSKLQDFREQVLSLVNQARAEQGLQPLQMGAQHNEVAQSHADEMYLNSYLSHSNLAGKSSEQRIADSGIQSTRSAENIARGQRTPSEVVQAWLESSGHRTNILNEHYSYLGVGYQSNYWVQVFTN